MEEICSECSFDESTTPPRAVVGALKTQADGIADTIGAIPDAVLRRRPAPGVWSPQEYLGHLRESMAFHRWLIERALAEQDPLIPIVDPDESVAHGHYNDADTAQLIAQFNRRIERLNEVLVLLDDDAANRTLALGDRRITVGLIARSAWHECHHHHGDLRRSLVEPHR
jgi:hypothetical protein